MRGGSVNWLIFPTLSGEKSEADIEWGEEGLLVKREVEEGGTIKSGLRVRTVLFIELATGFL